MENNSLVNPSPHKCIHTQPNIQKGPTERLKARLRRTLDKLFGRSEWKRNLLTSVAHFRTFDEAYHGVLPSSFSDFPDTV